MFSVKRTQQRTCLILPPKQFKAAKVHVHSFTDQILPGVWPIPYICKRSTYISVSGYTTCGYNKPPCQSDKSWNVALTMLTGYLLICILCPTFKRSYFYFTMLLHQDRKTLHLGSHEPAVVKHGLVKWISSIVHIALSIIHMVTPYKTRKGTITVILFSQNTSFLYKPHSWSVATELTYTSMFCNNLDL